MSMWPLNAKNIKVQTASYSNFEMPQESKKRPLIGVPTWYDQSQVYSGVNVCAMNRLYLDALKQAGGLPILIPLDLDQEGLRMLFSQLDGLFLAGGEDIGEHHYQSESAAPLVERADEFDRDRTELMLTRWALDSQLPTFGICRGMQLINVASGGTLYRDLNEQRPDLCKHNYFAPHYDRERMSHGVELTRDSLLADLFGSHTVVNSIHILYILENLGKIQSQFYHAAEIVYEAVRFWDGLSHRLPKAARDGAGIKNF